MNKDPPATLAMQKSAVLQSVNEVTQAQARGGAECGGGEVPLVEEVRGAESEETTKVDRGRVLENIEEEVKPTAD